MNHFLKKAKAIVHTFFPKIGSEITPNFYYIYTKFLLFSQLALDIWIMMLRFMGDLPEPVVEEDIPKEAAPTGLRKKISTLGRKSLSNKNKLIAQTGGLEGEEGYQPEEDDEQAMVRN